MDFISSMMYDLDFLCLQEHHLFQSEFYKFGDLCGKDSTMYAGKSAMDMNVFHRGRKFGGTAIIWKNSLRHSVSQVDTISKRLTAIKVTFNENQALLLFSIYMPCDEGYRGENFNKYQDILSEISTICQRECVTYVCLAGDFNTDFTRSNHQTQELIEFCHAETLAPLTQSSKSSVTCTFDSAVGSNSCIDHIIVTENLAEMLNKYYVIDNINNFSDHTPVIAEFHLECEYLSNSSEQPKPKLAWYKASFRDTNNYKRCLDALLQSKFNDVTTTVLSCRNLQCHNPTHIAQLTALYSYMIDSCLKASWETIPCSGRSKSTNKRAIPGFSEFCKPRRDNALYWHQLWKTQGRPVHGYYAQMRKISRAEYHRSVKMVKRREDQLRSQRMAESYISGNHDNFWKEVRRINRKSKCLPRTVDGLTDPHEISELFARKYEELYNSVNYDKDKVSKLYKEIQTKIVQNDSKLENALFTVEDISKAVKSIKANKSDGYMGLYSDHILQGSDTLFDVLSKLFNSMMLHGCCIGDMLLGTLTPLPKDRRASLSNSDNFRSICLQSVLCKLFDVIIMTREQRQLFTSEMQFGFKSHMSTSVATAVLQETIEYYNQNGGTVYALALDASKAFDRVEFVTLFRKLFDRNLNPLYLRFLMQMYCSQRLRVAFNDKASDWFSISNGVKQGGVLSPTLFSVYIDGMLDTIREKRLGCHVGNNCVGILGYADDVILLSPTVQSLKCMIKVCEEYAKTHCIKFNGRKSQLIVFGKHNLRHSNIYVNGENVPFVKEIKYLGHTLTNNVNDPLVKYVKRDFTSKVNAYLANFSGVTADVKGKLFNQYCMSLYGSNACMLFDQSLVELDVAWRKAIRRVWSLPYRTHCSLLPHISGNMPIRITLYKRFIKHFLNGYNHSNEAVKNVFRSSLYTNSRMHRNVKHIANYCNVSVWTLIKGGVNSVCKLIETVWWKNVQDCDIRIGKQIKELCDMRDDCDEEFLEKQEVLSILEFLCLC